MSKGKVAVAVVHGIGKQEANFADEVAERLHLLCLDDCGDGVRDEIVVRGVHWAQTLNTRQDDLRERINVDDLRGPFNGLRDFLIHFAADAIAYNSSSSWVYARVHRVFAETLSELRRLTTPDAPLFIISHSLGTVVASNYLWDLQQDYKARQTPRDGIDQRRVTDTVRAVRGERPSPLEEGRTLTMLYTLGSPIGLWSLKFFQDSQNKPIDVPRQPGESTHTGIQDWLFDAEDERLPRGWHNWYDREDIIGYPLSGLNEAYDARVQDSVVNVGNILTSRTPMSHVNYFKDDDVIKPIARNLIKTWQAVEDGGIRRANPAQS